MLSFDSLIPSLRARLEQPLPGPRAHEVMRAVPVGELIPKFNHKLPPKPGAVLIVLLESDNRVWFPLIKRSEYLGAHSGQISLPGGKAETGEDAVATALREGEEEIGIRKEDLLVIGQLSPFFVIPSNFIVTPVVAVANTLPKLNPDPREVVRILKADLYTLIGQDAIKNKEIIAAGNFRMMAPHFEVENEVVWGATAMMLNEFCEVVRESLQ